MPADKSVSIKVQGLAELRLGFKQLSDQVSTNGLKEAFFRIAESVATLARSKMPMRSGRARTAVKAQSSARGASVSFGGSAAPYGPWLEFGGSVGRGHRQGVGFSGAIKRDWLGRGVGEGRYVYPAIRAEREHIREVVEKAMGSLARKEGF